MADLLSLLLCALLVLVMPVSSQPDQLLFAGFSDASSNLTLTGIAEIEKNGILKLTNDTSRLMGHAFYASPFQMKNSTTGKAYSFSTCFALTIVPEYPKLGGHGMAFTIATTKDLKALPSQYLGLLNSSDLGNFTNHLFAVEFDTVQDFEFGDINDNHVGIDINSMVSNKSATVAYYADDLTLQNLTLKSGIPILAWIDYDSAQNVINVTLSPSSTKPRKPILSFDVDLSPILHDYMYVGFSASTGLLASSHYILGWSFKINGGPAPALDVTSLPKPPGPKKKQTSLVTGVTVSVVVIVLSAISIAIYLFRKIKNADVIEDWELQIGPHRYTYQELKRTTKGFKDKELLGRGGFGRVYKGTLPNSKTEVAVKRISHDSRQGLREFVAEIASIGRLRHRNLVQLLGWCRRQGDLLLVYEYMANGSLDKYLFDEPKMVLTWEQRYKIIKGVASGLLYLHEGYEQVVLHRDVKASNVLLDSEMNGKLGDFGLARLYEHGANPSTTRVVGTLGYLAPEIPRTGKSTTGSDVFSFGAFLLEVVCGRRPIDPKARQDELVLVDWIWEMYKQGMMLVVVDPNLNGHYNESEVLLVLKLGMLCSVIEPSGRPSMRQVVRYLEGEIKLPEDLREAIGCCASLVREDEGFDAYLHSFTSSSFDRMTSFPFTDNNNKQVNAGSNVSFPSSVSLLDEKQGDK